MKRIASWLGRLHRGSSVAIQKGNERLVARVTEITHDRIMVEGYPGFFHRSNGAYVVRFYQRPQLLPAERERCQHL